MIIKCKMCGGDIEFTPGATYGTCEYCGSTSTIPKVEDEKKLNHYNRANHFRRQCEFDKAVAAYEKILEQDDMDAEAHWGTVLSRFGIEYVEDPVSHERIPTCHRVQVASILADADYLSAVKYAPDAESRRLYEEQANQIAEIQKGILAISVQEEPYDVFICYKESTDGGSRTKDSTIAQDIYYQLTNAGYKVFFSRITLEDKLGKQYEPYIFAALNSAKVMLAIGTKPEHFSAVWVKNEWSRFLALMRQDRTKLLIPCYRDMDPYDLPEELSMLQSQDMNKIGFMQDLLHGVKKVLEGDKAVHNPQTNHQAASEILVPGLSSLMERAYLFMEDGDFQSANEYLNRVLDIDPKYAPAYAAKACVSFGMRKESELAEATFLYEDNADWKKALRFANDAQRETYEGYIAKVRERVNLQIRNFAYDCAVEMAVNPSAERNRLDAELENYKAKVSSAIIIRSKQADGSRRANSKQNWEKLKKALLDCEPGDVSEKNLKIAAEMFAAIQDADAAECAKQCLVLAEKARQKKAYQEEQERREKVYQKAMRELNDGYRFFYVEKLERLIREFQSIPDYKDANKQVQKCLDKLESIRSEQYYEAVSVMKKAGGRSQMWATAKQLLNNSDLNNYRNVDELRKQAEIRYEKCLAAKKKRKILFVAFLIVVAAAYAVAKFAILQYIIPQ